MMHRLPTVLHVRKMRVLCFVRKVLFCPTKPCAVAAVARCSVHGFWRVREHALPNLHLHPGTPSAHALHEGKQL